MASAGPGACPLVFIGLLLLAPLLCGLAAILVLTLGLGYPRTPVPYPGHATFMSSRPPPIHATPVPDPQLELRGLLLGRKMDPLTSAGKTTGPDFVRAPPFDAIGQNTKNDSDGIGGDGTTDGGDDPNDSSEHPEDVDHDYGGSRESRVCLDLNGRVHAAGERFSPSTRTNACPCVCTARGPVCGRPACPRLPARCSRVRHRGCCPQCRAFRTHCRHGVRRYALLQEFRVSLSPCESCVCGADGEVHCTVSACPIPPCVNPVYDAHRCCPICNNGPNCYAGSLVIPAGSDVAVNCSVCRCQQEGEWWRWENQANCTQLLC
uniref:VWFC domain-containing protein n=1 Tax=Eptatretus burgeri TaxID=7764 RepID=A0A8C4QTL7_EPTBU